MKLNNMRKDKRELRKHLRYFNHLSNILKDQEVSKEKKTKKETWSGELKSVLGITLFCSVISALGN